MVSNNDADLGVSGGNDVDKGVGCNGGFFIADGLGVNGANAVDKGVGCSGGFLCADDRGVGVTGVFSDTEELFVFINELSSI